MAAVDKLEDPRFLPAVDMLRRTGVRAFQVRWSDDEEPIVWFCVGQYSIGEGGKPQGEGELNHWESASGHDPMEALLRLIERVMDGGVCVHCHRPAMFVATLDDSPSPFDPLVCITSWDPELSVYRRDCEGNGG